MEIITLPGSPHKNGWSNMLADEFVKGAKEAVQNMDIIESAERFGA